MNDTTKHTAGPWQVRVLGERNAVVAIDGETTGTIGGIYRGGEEDMLSPADARLIAAAPDLYDALNGLIDWGYAHIGLIPVSDLELWENARAAIAEATGTEEPK